MAHLSIDELLAVKAKSPGARKKDSPWNDPDVGFPAMCEKTARRRLARSMPLNVMQYAARLEEAYEEQGMLAHVTPTHLVTQGDSLAGGPVTGMEDQGQEPLPTTEAGVHIYKVALADGSERQFQSVETWAAFMRKGLDAVKQVGKLESFWRRNKDHIDDAREIEGEAVDALEKDYQDRHRQLRPQEKEEPAYG